MLSKITNKLKKIKKTDPFLMTITVFSDKSRKKLDTYLFANNFPFGEFDGTGKMIKKLINEEKEKRWKE